MHNNNKHRYNHDTSFFKITTPIRKKHTKRRVQKPSDFSQTPLLKKINTYLKKMGRKNDDGSYYQTTSGGYCHGLTLLFLEKMAEGNVQWFYDIKKTIIECKESQLEEMELEIEKFLAMIEWAQNSSTYTKKKIRYFNVDLILETQPQQFFDDLYTFERLKNFLTYKQGKANMICITNCYGEDKEHTIGIFTDGVYYHLFDANYKSGQAVSFRSSTELTKEVLNRLYTNFDEEIPFNAELEIKIVHRPALKKQLCRSNTEDLFSRRLL